jgi:hypothetical protein
MPSSTDAWRISEHCVRIILLRVLPGRELEVGRSIERRCRRLGIKERHFRVFRLFGSYDLVFIQDPASLSIGDFTRLGAFPHVIGALEHVCYKWVGSDIRPAEKDERPSPPLLGLCFLKINPRIVQRSGIAPEVAFARHLSERMPSARVLGSLGWFELVVMLSEQSLGRILKTISDELPNIIYSYQEQDHEVFADKTLSMVGHSLNLSDTQASRAEPAPLLFDGPLKKKQLTVQFAFSCRPGAMAGLIEAARRQFGLEERRGQSRKINVRLGARDVDFLVPLREKETLRELIQSLDAFRKQNSEGLLKTYTDLQYQGGNSWSGHTGKGGRGGARASQPPIVGVSRFEAKQMVSLGGEGGALVSTIYRFNNLIENGLISDAYRDLVGFVQHTKELVAGKRNLTTYSRHLLVDRLAVLEQAIGQRSEGVYTGLEETPSVPGPSGTSMQRVLSALEVYVGSMLRRVGQNWGGCVVFGLPRFEHREEAIVVPAMEAVCSWRHWGIAHEAMHVLQFMQPETFSSQRMFPEKSGRALERFKQRGSAYREWYIEIVADVLVYALTCPLTVEEYLDVIWPYLLGEVFERVYLGQVRSYLLRSFAVICYAEASLEAVRNGAVADLGLVEEAIRKHLGRLRRNRELAPMFRTDERGEKPIELVLLDFKASIAPALRYIFPVVCECAKQAGAVGSRRKEAMQIIRRLEQGEIVRERELLSFADAVAWLWGAKKSRPSDRAALAWILSLWDSGKVSA